MSGVWPEGADGTDVNSCARGNNLGLLASADDFGKVNLYKYPSNIPKVRASSLPLNVKVSPDFSFILANAVTKNVPSHLLSLLCYYTCT